MQQISFGKAIIIKTKQPEIAFKLASTGFPASSRCKYFILTKGELFNARSSRGRVDADRDGFHRGILCDDAEMAAMTGIDTLAADHVYTKELPVQTIRDAISGVLKYITANAEEVVISSLDELKNLPMLKNIKF